MKYYLLLALVILVASCSDNHRSIMTAGAGGNSYARLFNIIDSGAYYRLDIFSPWQGGDDVVISYFLADDIKDIPGDIDESRKIGLPVTSSICLSTTHVAMISACGHPESIVGVSGLPYVSDSTVRKRIDYGLVKDVGYDSNLNTELITSLKPDVVFVYGIGPESAGYISILETVGIPALYICDYLELHPLAKAEWIKLFGLLYGDSTKTDSIFTAVMSEYELIRDSLAAAIVERPVVMLGLPYKDKWFVSPGNSYISQLLKDAGGKYIWEDYNSPESMPLGIEAVFREALGSDYWLNIGAVSTKDELLAFDSRFKELAPVANDKLYNNILRLNSEGGNDYWESGSIHPEIILKDIASILHPGLIGDHKLHYYKKIE